MLPWLIPDGVFDYTIYLRLFKADLAAAAVVFPVLLLIMLFERLRPWFRFAMDELWSIVCDSLLLLCRISRGVYSLQLVAVMKSS